MNLSLTASISSAVLSCSIALIYNYFTNKEVKRTKLNQIISFPWKLNDCRRTCIPSRIPCSAECLVLKIQLLVNALETAEHTLDICIFIITSNDLAKAIVRAKARGVRVRIICSQNMALARYTKISWFVSSGIPIKVVNNYNTEMNLKYCIIDSDTENGKFLASSTNWTLQELCGNNKYCMEYCVFIKDPVIAKKYQVMFNYMWDKRQN